MPSGLVHRHCVDCAFWVSDQAGEPGGWERVGRCARRAPVVGDRTRAMGEDALFPRIAGNGWCGEWVKRVYRNSPPVDGAPEDAPGCATVVNPS